MTRYAETPRVAIQVSRDVVVASIQTDLDEEVLERFQEDLLGRLHATGSRAVILDVSGLETLDSSEFAALRRIISAAAIMGTPSVLVGLRPGVVSALIELNADVEGLQTAIDLDAAFELLEPAPAPEPEPEPDGDDPSIASERAEAEASELVEPEWIFEDDR
jgi:rsbT antagonist protein RsbS